MGAEHSDLPDEPLDNQPDEAAELLITVDPEQDFSTNFGLLEEDESNLICVFPWKYNLGVPLSQWLEEYRPSHVILYDPTLTAVRQIEAYRAGSIGSPCVVYFLVYDSSLQEQQYLTSVRNEKEAFEHLIKFKASMALPVDQDGRSGIRQVHEQSLHQRDLGETSTRNAGKPLAALPVKVSSSLSRLASSCTFCFPSASLGILGRGRCARVPERSAFLASRAWT
eukprot:m.251827 g.251827  ORF g.251827 m.251827 type:complete len:224 (+) comp54515_c0_seq8:270-941(+)